MMIHARGIRTTGIMPLVLLAVGISLVAIADLYLVFGLLTLILAGANGPDWIVFVRAVAHAQLPDLYADSGAFRWSPVAAYAFVPIVALGLTVWRILHLVALLFLPRRVALLTLLAWPLWYDVLTGNVMTFVLVTAWNAREGKRWAQVMFVALSLLIPRPLMLPLLGWMLWKQKWLRAPAIALVVSHAAAVLWSGQMFAWVIRLADSSGDIASSVNIAPSAFIGWSWMLIAAPLAVIALRRGWTMTAGLLIEPYWLPYYLLVPIADIADQRGRE